VLNEAEFTREFGPDGAPQMVPLDVNALTQLGLWLPARPETEQEIEDYVNFAIEVDDGEAQALAIAKHRGFVLLTDDRKAVKVA
jgi:predicted nucleic acid-binding protein